MAKDKPFPLLPQSILEVAPASAELIDVVLPQLIKGLEVLALQLNKARASGDTAIMSRAFVALHRVKSLVAQIHGEEGGMLNGLFATYKSEIVPAMFDEAGIKNVPLVEGYRVQTGGKIFASIKADAKEQAYQWLRDNGLGALVVETVNVQTLSAAAKVMAEEENRELPEEFFNTMDKFTTSVNPIKAAAPRKKASEIA